MNIVDPLGRKRKKSKKKKKKHLFLCSKHANVHGVQGSRTTIQYICTQLDKKKKKKFLDYFYFFISIPQATRGKINTQELQLQLGGRGKGGSCRTVLLLVDRVTGKPRDLDSRGLQVAEWINTARLPGEEQWGAGKISSSPGSWHATRMESLPVRLRHQLFLLASLPFCARERAGFITRARGERLEEKKHRWRERARDPAIVC